MSLIARPSALTRSARVSSPRASWALPDSLLRGLVWAPDMGDLVDPVSGIRGVATGTTYDATYDAWGFSGHASGDKIVFATDPIAITPGGPSSSTCWVRRDTLAAAMTAIAIDHGGGAGRIFQFLQNDTLEYFHDGATDKRQRSGVLPFSAGEWIHVAWTDTGADAADSCTLYVDGAEVPSYSFSQDGATLDPAVGDVYIGFTPGVANPEFDGLVSPPRIYDRVLSAAEVATLASMPKPG